VFKFYVSKDDIEKLHDDFENIELDVQKHIQWYINQVYEALRKQHTKAYTYTTPPGSARKNLYLRSGKLRNALRESKYVKKISEDEWEAGFNIRPGTYLDLHVGERGDPPTAIKSLGRSDIFLGRMTIPLRAALNSNGTPRIMSARSLNNILILPFHVLESGEFGSDKSKMKKKPLNNRKILGEFKRGKLRVDFSGEDTSKFNPNSLIVCKKSGRRLVPLF
jgi:hypothetical protein